MQEGVRGRDFHPYLLVCGREIRAALDQYATDSTPLIGPTGVSSDT